MHIAVTLKTTEVDSRCFKIDCPACRKEGVLAQFKDLRQTLLLFHIIPIFFHKPTMVKCLACGGGLTSTMPAGELERIGDAHFAARYLRLRISPIVKALVFGGIIAWMLPAIGTVWTGLGLWCSRKNSGWFKRLAIIVFSLSLLPTAALIIGTAFSEPKSKRPSHRPEGTPAEAPPPNPSQRADVPHP